MNEGSGLRRRNRELSSDQVVSKQEPTVIRGLKKLDAYAKVQDDFKVKTSSGGTVSLVAWMLIIILLVSETSHYMKVGTKEHMLVDTSMGEKLRINMNITFHAIDCNEVHLDAMDVAGDNQLDMEHSLTKQRVSKNGKFIGKRFVDSVNTQKGLELLPDDYCGSCYGADATKIATAVGKPPRLNEAGEPCCNTCQDVVTAYGAMGWSITTIKSTSEQCAREQSTRAELNIDKEAKEGCNLSGIMEVNKVAGNFHVAIGDAVIRDGRHIHQFDPATAHLFNITHTIHSLSFGLKYPGMEANPLDGATFHVDEKVGTGLNQYFIQIVPTIYKDGSKTLTTNQFSYTKRFRPLHQKESEGEDKDSLTPSHSYSPVLPGVFFIYDVSPFMVEVSKVTVPLTHFLTKICAIAGGVYTVAGIIDSLIYHGKSFSKGMLPS